MPFCAVDKDANRINLLDQNYTRGNLPQELFCPHCDGKMIYVDGNFVIKHFRHKIECPFQTEPETEKHLAMKAFIKKIYPSSLLERRIGDRIADAILPEEKISVENQVSSIGVKEMIERTQDHNKKGFSTMWIFGWRNLLQIYKRSKYLGGDENDEGSWRDYYQFFAKKTERFLQMANYGKFYHFEFDKIFSIHLLGWASRSKRHFVFNPIMDFKLKKYVYSTRATDTKFIPSFMRGYIAQNGDFDIGLASFCDAGWWKDR